MAGRDYLLCRTCGHKIIYDGNDRIRDRLEDTWGDPDYSTWTVTVLCPECDKRREAEIEQLRVKIADAEEDTKRLRHLANEPVFDVYGEVDLHEEASINASALGREEPTSDDYLAAMRAAIDSVRKGEEA